MHRTRTTSTMRITKTARSSGSTPRRGYGFITRENGEDLFVHFRNIKGRGRRSLNDGEPVTFVVIEGDKGLQADQVSAQ